MLLAVSMQVEILFYMKLVRGGKMLGTTDLQYVT